MKTAHFILNKIMPIWLIVCSLLVYASPHRFIYFGDFSIYYLTGVILLMSLTLTIDNIKPVFGKPKALVAGFIIKWLTVPAAAVLAAHLIYSSQPQLAALTILDGSTPAGVTSSLFTCLSNGPVALAIALTLVHTLVSPLLTPVLALVFALKYVHFSFYPLFQQMILVVLLPLIVGVGVRTVLGTRRAAAVKPFLPMGTAVLLYCLIFGLVAATALAISQNLIWIPVIAGTTSCFCILNMIDGYALTRLLRLDEANSRAIMFDAGVYSSGLGAVLAKVNFGPFAAVPALMNMLLNLIIGSMLVTYLHGKTAENAEKIPVAPTRLHAQK